MGEVEGLGHINARLAAEVRRWKRAINGLTTSLMCNDLTKAAVHDGNLNALERVLGIKENHENI